MFFFSILVDPNAPPAPVQYAPAPVAPEQPVQYAPAPVEPVAPVQYIAAPVEPVAPVQYVAAPVEVAAAPVAPAQDAVIQIDTNNFGGAPADPNAVVVEVVDEVIVSRHKKTWVSKNSSYIYLVFAKSCFIQHVPLK